MVNKLELDAPDKKEVLGKALLNTIKRLGYTQQSTQALIGKERSTISRYGIDPQSKEGEISLLLIRCYRSLGALFNDNEEQIKTWFNTENKHIGGVPYEQAKTLKGLTRITQYLDAIRGKP